MRDKRFVVSVVPSHTVREVLGRAGKAMRPDAIVISASKGIENETLATMDEVLKDVLPGKIGAQLAFLSGPSFAKEVAVGLPTAVVMASRDRRVAEEAAALFQGDRFRVYTSDDVPGVELGGALKNVMAIAAGVADGLGLGHNSRAALITRGLAEISRLAVRKAANPLTLAGLAGLGDLVLTCTGDLSRNRPSASASAAGRRCARCSPACRRWPRASRRPRAPTIWRSGSASRCPSPTRCTASSTRTSRRAKRSARSWAARPSTSWPEDRYR